MNTKEKQITNVIIDEAQFIISLTDREEIQRLPIVDSINRGRKYGIGITLLFQSVANIHPIFLTQPNIIMAGTLSHEDDKRIIGKAMGFTNEQYKYYTTMPKRTFLVKKIGSSVFPMKIPDINLNYEIVKPEFIQSWNKEAILQNPELEKLFYKEIKKQVIIIEKDDGFMFVNAVNTHPCYPTAYYYKVLEAHYQQAKANVIRKGLIEKGYLKSHKINTGSKIFFNGLEITELGYEKYGIRKNFMLSKGAGFVHSYIVENLKRYYEKKGNKTEKEKQIKGHFCDLFVEPDLAIEVAIGNTPSYEAKNIHYDIDSNYRTNVVGIDKDHLEDIKKLLPELFQGSMFVDFKLFCDFL